MKIEVKQTNTAEPMEFDVIVRESNGTTRHHVTMKKSTYDRLAAARATPERLIEAAFEFLLEHEPKESILARFDVTVISQYFPDFERKIGSYLD